MEAKAACRFITGALSFAATHDCESQLAQVMLADMAQGRSLSLSSLKAKFAGNKDTPTLPVVTVVQHALHQYDELLTNGAVYHS